MASSDPASTASAASAVALSVVVGPGGGSWRWVVEGLVVRGPSFFLVFLPIIYCLKFSPTTACASRAPTARSSASSLQVRGDNQRPLSLWISITAARCA